MTRIRFSGTFSVEDFAELCPDLVAKGQEIKIETIGDVLTPTPPAQPRPPPGARSRTGRRVQRLTADLKSSDAVLADALKEGALPDPFLTTDLSTILTHVGFAPTSFGGPLNRAVDRGLLVRLSRLQYRRATDADKKGV